MPFPFHYFSFFFLPLPSHHHVISSLSVTNFVVARFSSLANPSAQIPIKSLLLLWNFTRVDSINRSESRRLPQLNGQSELYARASMPLFELYILYGISSVAIKTTVRDFAKAHHHQFDLQLRSADNSLVQRLTVFHTFTPHSPRACIRSLWYSGYH